ncbi:MAG TPA: hypothetical protein VHH36_04650, partial [Candidatus Thermoplasmatota archaeon]|nr:hypothetical protein [Candidatus Thermoplasmatota archaeon]
VSVPAATTCPEAARDADGDGVPVVRVCSATLTAHPDGRVDVVPSAFLAQVGDPNDNDPTTPVPPIGPVSAPIAKPCDEATRDADGDLVRVARVCAATVTVHPDGRVVVTDGAVLLEGGDPDDADPGNPISDPRRPIPVEAAEPCSPFAADADGDAYPVVRLCEATHTFHPDGRVETVHGPVLVEVGDPDDGDASQPVRDADRDGVPDDQEATLCANGSTLLHSDGDCEGANWSPPTPAGVIEDVLLILP